MLSKALLRSIMVDPTSNASYCQELSRTQHLFLWAQGVTNTDFHSCGSSPACRNKARLVLIPSAAILRILGLISSTQVALLVSRLHNRVHITSSSSILRKANSQDLASHRAHCCHHHQLPPKMKRIRTKVMLLSIEAQHTYIESAKHFDHEGLHQLQCTTCVSDVVLFYILT